MSILTPCAVMVDDTGQDRARRYLTLVTTRISSKGQIVLPAEIRQQDGIEPGQQFQIKRIKRGEYRLVLKDTPPNDGLVDWLLACPKKDFFVPIETESTDTLRLALPMPLCTASPPGRSKLAVATQSRHNKSAAANRH